MPNEEDRKWLYGQFKDNGYDTGSYEDFVQSLDNDEDFEWWHNEATSLGLEVGDLAEFGSLFRTPKQETATQAVEGDVPTNFDDQPDMRALNDKARKRAEKEQKRVEKEQQALASAPRKDYSSISPQERRKAFNEQFQQRQMEKAEANPKAWEMEQKAIEENNELARQEAKTEKALNVPNYGTSGAYSVEEADLAAREYAEIAPELRQFDARLNDFNQKYGPLEDKIKQLNEGKLQLSPEEYNQLQSDYAKYKKESEGLSLIAKKYDSVLNSAPGKEYREVSERLNELSNGPKTPESILEYADEYAKLQRNPIYRASLGEKAPSEDEIQASALQSEIAYYEEKMKTAKGDEKKELKKAFSNAKSLLYNNPWYKAHLEGKIAENKAENETIGLERAAYVQKLREGYKAQGIDPQYYWQMEKGDPELQRLDAAAHMHDDAIREYEKPTKYDDSKGLKNVGKGFGKWASDTDNWSFGIEGFVEDIAVVRPVLEKVEKIVGNVSEDDVMTEGSMKALEEQLTPGELAVLDAYFEKVGAVSAKGADTSVGYQIGQGIGDMVTLGLEMIATGGAGGAVRGVAEKGMKKGLIKLLGKRAYRKAAQSGAGKVALWAASKVPADVAETLVRLPFMPSTYKAIGEGAIELDSDYKTRDFMEYAPEKAYDQFVEQLTEVSNGFAFPLIGKVVKTPGMQKFIKGMLGDDGARALRAFMERGDIKLLDDAMLGSFGGEWEEELLGAFIHSITDDPKALSDFFSAEQQLVLLGTLAPLPLSRGTVGGVQLAVPAAKAGVAWSRAEKELSRLGFDEGRIARLKEVLDNATVPEAAREIMSAYKDSVEGFMVAEEANNVVRGTIDATELNWEDHGKLYGLLGEYLWAAQQKRAAGLMAEIQQDQKVAQKRAELESRLGGAFTHEYHSANGNTFEVVERNTMVGPDGNPVNIFITSENYNDSGEKSYVTEDGSRRGFVSRENLEFDYGVILEADRYFARLVMQDEQAQAAQGMVNEAVTENRSLREQVEMLPEITFNGQKGTIARATEDGAVFIPDDETQENMAVTWAELAEANGIAVPDIPTPAENAEAVAMAEAARYQQKQDIADGFTAAMQSNADLQPEVDTDEGHAVVTGIISNTIDPDAGTAQFTVMLDNGRRSVTTSIPIESILSQITPATTTEVPAEAPVEAPAAEAEEPAVEEPVEEAPKIPVDKKGNPIYDAPGVTIEDAIEDIYSTPGVSDEMGDQYIREMAAETEKGRNPKRGKMNIKEWGEATAEANRKADFWKQMKEVADANTAARKEDEKKEAERQALIDKYGVDTSNFDLTPQSLEEAVAAYLGGDSVGLINLDDAIRETLGKRKDNRVPTELFKHLGQYGILTKKGGSSVQAVADDIVRDFYGDLDHDDQADEARDYIINFLLNSTKKEMREFIFNNRLDEARKLAEYAETSQEEEAQEPETPVEEPVVETPETEETTEETTEDLPEEETAPEAPTVEEPAAEPRVETPETETKEEPAEEAEETENKEENAGKSEEKTVTSQEEESAPKKEGESTYGSSNKVVSKARYEELRKKMLEKLKGQMNAGFDPEIFAYGVEMAAYHIEAGARKFIEFARNIINDLGDAIRPYLKAIYNGARDLPGMEEIKNEMTPASEVEGIDINADFNALSDEQDNTDVQQGDGGVSGTDTDSDGQGAGGESGTGDESADGGNAEEDNDAGGDEGGSGSVAGEGTDESGGGPGNEGADATAGGGRRGGRKANDGKSTRKGSGRRGGSRRGENEGADGVGRDTDVEEETEEQKEAKAAKAEQEAYDAEKERIKGETDTNSLKKLFNEIKEKLTGLTDKFDEARAKLAGQLRAVRERLQELFSKNVNKSEALAQEKVPYSPVSDPTGEHAIGSVVPSGSADYMRDAIKRLEKEVGKPVAEFVMEELGYASLDEMFTTADKEKFTGLSSEQVDAVGLAIQQIKTGRIFIVGDMTGVGKGRVGAALIRWGHRHGKKVIFCTEQPNLFTAMYEDINDIGGLDRGKDSDEKTKGKRKKSQDDTAPLPFIINNAGEANITDDEDNVVVRHSNETQRSSLFTSGKDELPPVPGAKNKGKKYDFVMTTYSQLQATEEEEEGTSDKVKKKNERNTKGRQRIQWLKQYAKDAVVIMDESHTAAGTESTRGKNALKLVDAAQGVMFMSATFAKTPEAMGLYAVRSSMNEAQISRDQLIRAISDYGIPMQEILSATLYKTGEYVRRERDFDGVKTNWCQPEEIYTSAEIETARNLSDYTTGTINDIIDFQRRYVDPIIRRLNKDVADANRRNKEMFLAGITDSYTEISYSSTSYAGQVSNVVGMMLFAIKAKKAADMAIEQIKRGEKPVIAVDNTLGAYVDEIEGDVESADFGTVLKKGLAFALKYQMTTKKFVAGKGPHGEELRNKPKEVKGDRVVEKYDSIEGYFGDAAEDAIWELSEKIVTYGKETLKLDLSLSPIDYIKKRIEDAGYKCGEITKRQNALVQNEDGTWTKKPIKHNKKEVIRRFNGGKANSPLPKEETYDAVIMNRSGATGNSMHASRKFGDQRPRKMIILQAAKDPNNEVQIRGRIDRTGQVHRGEYFYIISPIPAEKKITMMLKQKLASLDAQSVGTENVSSNKVDAEDMDNKYGDEVAKEFLAEHQEINLQLDRPITQVFNRKTREMEWKGRPGLLYDLMKGMQRMTCVEQEMILQELEEAYSQKIEYLNQNGINDLATTTMDLEATTIDKAIMVKGKNNEAMSEFAHDTTIERVETNVLRKPLRSEDIVRKEKELGVFEKHEKTNSHGEKEDVSYGEYIQTRAQDAAKALREEKRRKQDEAEKKLADDIRVEFPREEGETEASYEERIYNDPRMATLRSRNEQDRVRYQQSLQEQLVKTRYATTYLKPGYVYLVPLNESDEAQTMYGRFMGFKAGKDGRPNSIEAVFATKDSRAQVSIPVVGMKGMIERIANTNNPSFGDLFGKSKYDYESEEARIKFYDEWWDKMIPEKTARSVRYMITGNILQAVGQLNQHRGMIVTFTRKDAETGEITIDKGLLLAEDFDPENFMVRTEITKDDVWNNAGEFRDTISHIAVFRDGNRLRVKFYRERNSKEDLSEHDINDDEEFKALCEDGQIIAESRDELHAVIPEENAAEALKILYRNYGFTQGHLLILPDSTDKPDRIVPTGKSYDAVINELQPKYRCWSASSCQSEINKLLKTYKMDITNEDVKTKIRELVQLRQAYLRKSYCKIDTLDLAWHIVISEQEIAQLERPVPNESPEDAKKRKDERQETLNLMEAFREELASREPMKGHMKHFKQGKIELSEIIKTFKEFNKDKENARIAEKVFAVMKKLNVNIFMDENATDNPRKRQAGGMTAGDYLMYNWRFMNEDTIPDQLKANTILHEMCHTMTAYVLEAINNGATSLIPGLVDAGKQADALYWAIYNSKAFTHNAGDGPTSGTYQDYGKKDVYEMLAETGANQRFRDDLATVKVSYKEETNTSFGKTRTSFEFTDVTESKEFKGETMTALEAAMDILERMIDGFTEDGYKKMWTGTGYGQMGYSSPSELHRRGESLRSPIDRASAISSVVDLANKLGVKFKEDSSLGAKGSFDPKTGQIKINVDRHADAEDLQITLLHEAVAHYGLRKLLGKDFASEIRDIYEKASPAIKERIDAIAKRDGLSTEVATEEYLAGLAEDGRFDSDEENIWRRLWNGLVGWLRDHGFNIRLTDADMRALLYASYRNLQTRGAVAQAHHISVQNALRKQAELSRENANFVDNGNENDRTGTDGVSDGLRGVSDVRGLPSGSSGRLSSNDDFRGVRVLEEGLEVLFREHPDYRDGDAGREGADRGYDSERVRRVAISESIIRTAKENGLFIDYSEFRARRADLLPGHTMESDVYFDAENNRYIKVRDPFVSSRLTSNKDSDILYQHIIHNLYFPSTRYTFLGVTQKPYSDEVRFVLSQESAGHVVKGASAMDMLNWYQKNGFVPGDVDKKYVHWFKKDGISVCDLGGHNLLLNSEGEWKPIDPCIRFDEDPRTIVDDNIPKDSEYISEQFGEGFNDLPEEVRQFAIEQDTDELYRRSSQGATAQTAAEMYGNNVRTIKSAVHEVLVDEYHPIDILMDALASESKSKIKDDERVSDMMRETGGKAMQEIREYDKKFLQPMWTAVGEFRKNTGSSIKDTEIYIGLKSGLERNVVLAKRDAKRDYQAEYDSEIDKINQEEKEKKKFLDRQLKNGKISDVTYAGDLTALQQEMKQKRDDAETERQARFADVDAGTDKRYLEYRKKDYSAITAWAEKEDLQEAEQLAADYVADMESRAGASTVKEMWKRINAATKETLKFQYEHQILSRQQYQDISRMMDYYVPMRGFSEDTAEDLFNYYVTAQPNDFQATVLTAKGRKTWYEGPLGNIGAMHSSAIAQGVKNTAKLSLLDAVRRRPENTIATVTRAWFVKNGQKDANGKDLYDVAYPQIPEGATRAQREAIVEQFEQDMKEAKERGDAYNSHREVDLHGGVVAFEKESHKNEHVVKVREGGKEYGIIINGNPAAAQALNGVRRSNGTGEKFLGIMRSWTRLLSSMFTTFSVPFWVSNFQRDHGQGLTNAFIRNNREYVGHYIKNRMRAIKLFPYIIGEESLDKAIAKGDPVAKLYKQYLDNGGPMGQNRIEDNEYFERKMKRFLDNSAKQGVVKGGQAVLNFIGGVGETIETITRFAVFMTSMEAGRPIHESVSDAKEISTNFARKGSGRSFSRDELDRMTHADGTKLNAVEKGFVNALSIGVEICRATIPFFNAAVQGLENKVTNYREHWGKTLAADSIYLMLGLGMKLLFGSAGGDDDKEKYSHTSDYLRRNNILNPLGNGVYAKWALPQEYRVMYALGDIIGSAIQQERPIEDLGADAFGALMQLSPIGAVTDEVAFSPENKKKAYETLITNASPGVIAPVLESIFNMDFKGARIYNEGFNENLRAYPGWTKALPTTGKEYVAAAKWLNEISGGNEVERGWININPAVVEHLVESYFSGPYQIVVRAPEAAVKVAKGEATVRDVPLLNRIILNTNDNQRDALYSNMYYYFKELNTEAARIHSEYKGRPKEGKAADFYKSKEYQYMLVFKKYDSMERNLRKASKVMDEKGDKKAKEGYDKRLEDIHYKIAKECLDIYFNRNGKEEVK